MHLFGLGILTHVMGRLVKVYQCFKVEAFRVDLPRWWQLIYFWNFHPDPWGNDQI